MAPPAMEADPADRVWSPDETARRAAWDGPRRYRRAHQHHRRCSCPRNRRGDRAVQNPL